MEERKTTPRMRTVRQVIQELKSLDRGTALTEHALRQMFANNDIPCVLVGNKKLINLDLLLEKLAGKTYNIEAIRVSGKEDETWRQ